MIVFNKTFAKLLIEQTIAALGFRFGDTAKIFSRVFTVVIGMYFIVLGLIFLFEN